MPAAPGCPSGRHRTGPSSTRTWCSGTPSVSPTSPDPRTGRSCRSSTPGSRSCPSASSTAIPRSTSRRARRTVMTEPQEYHPPVEEYLETMLGLDEEGVPVIQARIAERLGRSAPSVSEMLDRLREEGYVDREGRRLSLTPSGRALAEKVVRKHRLAERLLVDVIGLEWHKVHREAGRWEHVISDDVEARLVELLGDPATCPHGNPIPGSHSPAPSVPTRPLAEAGAGERVRLLRISEEVELNLGSLTLLDEGGFIPGVVARVGDRDPEGNMEVTVEGGAEAIRGSGNLAERLELGDTGGLRSRP